MFLDLIALVLLGGMLFKKKLRCRASSRGGRLQGLPAGLQDDGSLQNGTSHMSLEELLELQSQVGSAYKQLAALRSRIVDHLSKKHVLQTKHRPLEEI